MKRMIAFFKYAIVISISIILIIVFVFGFKFQPNKIENVIANFSNYQKITLVSKDLVKEHQHVENGDLHYYTFDSSSIDASFNFLSNYTVEGIVLYFTNKTGIEYFQQKLNYNLSQSRKVGDVDTYYGYLKEFNNFVINQNKKVNVQLAKTNNGWVMGLPLILTGF